MIDKDKLKELCSDPNNKSKDIRDTLGFKNDAAFYGALNRDSEAKEIFTNRARKSNAESTSTRASKPRGAKHAKRATPPRNGSAKGRVSDELLRKIKHEFEHIEIYQQVSEFFDELAPQVAQIK